MISVSSNELGLGFAGIEEDIVMEESDFEEESTHSYVSCVDPDVALSYIDEKLENVLGHFQKDFEGGVSAENLGAKYGGYGSFLSMYQRSPACSSAPKSPLEAQNQMGVRSNGSVVVPEVSVSGSTSKTPASDVMVKLKNFVNSSDSKQKPVSKATSSGPSSNHKTLKLRIKVGSSDLSSLKNSKEGLKLPQSSSQVNNCFSSEVEEGLLYEIGDSPTKILMAMVSFPLHKDQLLSPLSDDLIQFGKNEKIEYVSSVNIADSKGTAKKEKLKERVKSMPQSNKLDVNRIVSNTEKVSCEEIISKTLKLPILSPSYIQPKKEIDKVSDSYVEDVYSRARGKNNIDVVDAAMKGSKLDVEDNVVAFSNGSVKETESVNNTRKDVYRTEGETRSSLESKSKRGKAPSIERVDDSSSVDKVSQSERKNEEQILKSKLPKAQKSQKRSSRNSLRSSKDDVTVNIINKNVPEKLQEDIGESKEEKLSSSSLVLKAVEKEEVLEENTLKESIKNVKNYEEACNFVCELDSKHLIKSSDLNEDKHSTKQSVKQEENALKESFNIVKNDEEACNRHEDLKTLIKSSETKQSVKLEVTNKHSVEGMESERELTGTCKKPKTGRSSLSAIDKSESNKVPDIEALSAQKVKDIGKASSHDERKRKLKEDKENGDCMKLKESPEVVMEESSGEKARKKKRINGSSSCEGKELPFSSESCEKDKKVSQENGGKDSASHLPLTASFKSLWKDLGSEAKGSLFESRKIAEKDEPHDSNAGDTLKSSRDSEAKTSGRILEKDVDSNAGGDTLKRSRDGEGYNSNIDKPRTRTKKAAEISKDDECYSIELQRKNKEERSSSAPSKANTENEVEVKTKESRSKKRPARKEEDSREYHQDINGSHSKTSRGKSNRLEVTDEKSKSKSSAPTVSKEQVQVLRHGSEKTTDTKKEITRNEQNGSKLHKDHIGSSPLKKEISTSQAASNSIKEATDLKHMADRLKNGGSNHESTGVYFQAALKFLHGASLLESSSSSNNAKSRHIYGSTAKLCEFCAHEYEKNKDLGAAALAYKCMEVAYLRITYSSHANISRYRHELQAALQLIPPSGESPSLASSDGENPNHAMANTLRSSSPRVTGNNHVISSGNNSSVSQLLAFSQNVSYAMDASRKAQIAFATVKGKPFDNRYNDGDGITSIKRALDFSFQDMEKFLHVIRLAMESINR